MSTIDTTSGLSIPISEQGEGRTALVLHGGGGPATVHPLAAHLARTRRTVVPTHPGWNGTSRGGLTSVDDLALIYLNWLQDNDLRDVLVVGSSIGGWIAAEMAMRDQDAGRITGLVLVDAVGIDVPGHPIIDFFTLDARQAADVTWHDPDRFYVDPASIPQEQTSPQSGNMGAVRLFAGDPYMHDPKLAGRLSRVRVPSLAIWGDSDGIVTPDYGRAYAATLPACRFELIADAGHLPQLEQPEATFATLDRYLDAAP